MHFIVVELMFHPAIKRQLNEAFEIQHNWEQQSMK